MVGWTVMAACWAALSVGVSAADLEPGVKLEADGKVIDVKVGHLVPSVVDWNGDGKKDLIVGQFSGGKIRLYLNHGTDEAPQLKDFTYLKAAVKDGDREPLKEIGLPAG